MFIFITSSSKWRWKWLQTKSVSTQIPIFYFPHRVTGEHCLSWGCSCLKMLGLPLFFLCGWEYLTKILINYSEYLLNWLSFRNASWKWNKVSLPGEWKLIRNKDLGFPLLLIKPSKIMMMAKKKKIKISVWGCQILTLYIFFQIPLFLPLPLSLYLYFRPHKASLSFLCVH